MTQLSVWLTARGEILLEILCAEVMSIEKLLFCISDHNPDATEELEANFLKSFLIMECGHHLIYK